MKYHRLSQDQLNSVYKQFILFLSSKGIDKQYWDSIKKENNNKISLYWMNLVILYGKRLLINVVFLPLIVKTNYSFLIQKKNLFQ